MNSAVNPSFILFVSRDLMFESRVTGTAQALGVTVQTAGNVEGARKLAISTGCRCVLFDLSLGTEGLESLVADARAASGVPVIAFGSHVATALLEAARDAGCAEVMPRSRFTAILADLLTRYGRAEEPGRSAGEASG